MTAATATLSPAAYLTRERQSQTKSEYLDGQVHPMASASYNHNLIVAQLIHRLMGNLEESPCRVLPSDMRVEVGESYAYPDLVIVCDPPLIKEGDILLNPTILIEVLSPSTEVYDRGKKAQKFRTIASLKEYILVSQESHHIEHYIRQTEDTWLFSETAGEEREIYLPSIDCTLSLADIYSEVEFEK